MVEMRRLSRSNIFPRTRVGEGEQFALIATRCRGLRNEKDRGKLLRFRPSYGEQEEREGKKRISADEFSVGQNPGIVKLGWWRALRAAGRRSADTWIEKAVTDHKFPSREMMDEEESRSHSVSPLPIANVFAVWLRFFPLFLTNSLFWGEENHLSVSLGCLRILNHFFARGGSSFC